MCDARESIKSESAEVQQDQQTNQRGWKPHWSESGGV